MQSTTPAVPVSAIDLFCGAGGLSHGLQKAGVSVVAGVDLDPTCAYPFTANINAPFLERDVRELTAADLNKLWAKGTVKLLAGCAPCQPFSPYRRGKDTSKDEKWPLLDEFGRLVKEARPHLVTMENVTRLATAAVFTDFVQTLATAGYHVDWKNVYAPRYGLPQERRRLVLVASRIGSISVPQGHVPESKFKTVRTTIGKLPALKAGEVDAKDPLHTARSLNPTNLKRIKASKPGGSWADWPKALRAPCHQRATGSTFKNVYARMEWDKPSPTITTLSYNFGAGRFGHPVQNRPITLREAALLQGFPANYSFVEDDKPALFAPIGRLIGNAVPPPLGAAIGKAIVSHANENGLRGRRVQG